MYLCISVSHINKWTPSIAESGRFNLSVENEQADAERDGLSREDQNYQARTGTEKKNIYYVQLTTSRIGNLMYTRFSLSNENEQADAGLDG